ncbi:UvrD-helicase domain-containing protein [Variovorax terrae]|uniref:DNA 3'-5' helicase n=1 Tax=Variovorax terrae TaxID=2923278 RepID=A0A9X1VTG8_9BURK|nr:UvrD-helicase domain-containing protein [Variovorax terrae]MCJ0763060.1 UvrD-helicase domain-containing protein [Variovorax terrae]
MNAAAYEHNGRPVGCEQFYAIACDPARSVAVEACAGAGKTWMLVSRIVRALLEGAQPHEILAITFTKKAAGEMRQRLQEWLAEFAQAAPEQLEQELISRGVGPQAAREGRLALQNLYQTVLAAGRPVQIRTFHSWFAALLRTAPLAVLQALGLPASYELLEDDAEAVRQVWRRFHAAVAADAAARADFEAVVAAHGRFQAHKALEAALAKRVEFTLADAQGVVDASVKAFGEQFTEFAGLDTPGELLSSNRDHRQKLREAAVALGRASAPTFSAKGVELEQALTAGDMAGALAALLTQKGEPRKFSDKLAGIEQVRVAQDLALRITAAERQHAAWQYQQRMARLARRLIDEFAALKRERGWVDMNDVERAALVMLSDPVLAGWVQEKLDARIRHLLIDEFQDTNPLQWQALYAWLSGYAGAGQAPSVFIVGDPKQSIYRFRRAEPQVFRAAQAFVVDGLGGDLLSCDHTRRNARAVIATVNAVMGAAQAAGEYPGFRAHTTESREAGAVLCLPPIAREAAQGGEAASDPLHWRDSLSTPRELPEETLRTLECRQAAQWLAQQLQGGLNPKDIMVLARKRDRLAAMQEELRALHIPTQQPEKNDLADAPEVQDLMALLDVLVSPAHDLSLARALRSPLFGASDDDLVQLALLQRRGDGSWFDLLQKQELPAPVLPGLPAILRRWKGWIDTLPPHDALAAIYDDGDVLARFAAAAPAALRGTVLARLRALLAASLQIDGARYATPYALVRALKAGGTRAPASADADAVRLLTIHGAKGLEAPLVLLLDTDAAPPRAETMGVLVDWPGEAAEPRRFVFLASESNPPPCAVPLLQAEQAERRREELNALYVAMTRARGQLAASSVQPYRAAEGSWWQRLAPQAQLLEMADVPAPAAAAAVEGVAPEFSMLVLPDVRVQRASSAIKNEVEPGPDSLVSRIGQAMHRLLEWAQPGAAGLTPAQLQSVAREFELSAAQAQQAAAMAQRILQGAGAWAWNPDLIDWQGNEVELLWQGSLLRLDRLVRRRDTQAWWLLDYKSAAQPQRQPELMAQLRGYREALQAVHPGEVVRAAFLTGQGELLEVE